MFWRDDDEHVVAGFESIPDKTHQRICPRNYVVEQLQGMSRDAFWRQHEGGALDSGHKVWSKSTLHG
jgi:hypothetical protein